MLAEEYITSIDNNQEDRLVREIDTDSEWNPEKKRDVKKKRRRSEKDIPERKCPSALQNSKQQTNGKGPVGVSNTGEEESC